MLFMKENNTSLHLPLILVYIAVVYLHTLMYRYCHCNVNLIHSVACISDGLTEFEGTFCINFR